MRDRCNCTQARARRARRRTDAFAKTCMATYAMISILFIFLYA